jgi:hypothetical protein
LDKIFWVEETFKSLKNAPGEVLVLTRLAPEVVATVHLKKHKVTKQKINVAIHPIVSKPRGLDDSFCSRQYIEISITNDFKTNFVA